MIILLILQDHHLRPACFELCLESSQLLQVVLRVGPAHGKKPKCHKEYHSEQQEIGDLRGFDWLAGTSGCNPQITVSLSELFAGLFALLQPKAECLVLVLEQARHHLAAEVEAFVLAPQGFDLVFEVVSALR